MKRMLISAPVFLFFLFFSACFEVLFFLHSNWETPCATSLISWSWFRQSKVFACWVSIMEKGLCMGVVGCLRRKLELSGALNF